VWSPGRDFSVMHDLADRIPWARAVVRDGRVTLNDWNPRLLSRGPARAVLLRSLPEGVTVADLLSEPRADGREELVVRWIPDGRTSSAARAAISEWAALVGYARVWFPEAVVDFAEELPGAGRVETTCPTCGATWEDESAEFWLLVRGQGFFPGHCPICNASMPEWAPAAGGPASTGWASTQFKPNGRVEEPS
jgi:hypothetical protein